MRLHNTAQSYGSVARALHWTMAALILANIPLGLVASDLARGIAGGDGAASQAMIDRAALLFSIHKTTGVTVLTLALLRILWALVQTRPRLLNGDRAAEATLAATVHWLLYAMLVAVPLSGWVTHAATTGFAPIWWPFGQSLPFVPKDQGVERIAGTLHWLFQWLLIGAIAAHVAGALKHHLIDRDATLLRMLTGLAAQPTARQPGHALPATLAALALAAVLGGAGAAGWLPGPAAEKAATRSPELVQTNSEWQVTEGRLGITVTQMGSPVTGNFAEWTAEIAYDPQAPADGPMGEVAVTVAIPSLSLGSVTKQAMGKDFLDGETYPTARFEGEIHTAGDAGAHEVRGAFTLKGTSQPLTLPFTLQVEGDTAQAHGRATVDRRDFGIGSGVGQGSLGFEVEIGFNLRATRSTGTDVTAASGSGG